MKKKERFNSFLATFTDTDALTPVRISEFINVSEIILNGNGEYDDKLKKSLKEKLRTLMSVELPDAQKIIIQSYLQ